MTVGRGARGTLFVVGTPIGNLDDISVRALETLRSCNLIVAEDTRVTKKLLTRFEISTRCTSVREQNAKTAVPPIIDRLEQGEDVALVTDAGTPGISDPGEDLVCAAAEKGIHVSPIPGPSALAAAVSVCALKGSHVRFLGFLSRNKKERRLALDSLVEEPGLAVVYESPKRLLQTLRDLEALIPTRRCAVMRELTKIHEEIVRGTPKELIQHFSDPPRGEITLVIEGAPYLEKEVGEDELFELVSKGIESGRSAKDLSQSLSTALGIPKKRIYQKALEILKAEK